MKWFLSNVMKGKEMSISPVLRVRDCSCRNHVMSEMAISPGNVRFGN